MDYSKLSSLGIQGIVFLLTLLESGSGNDTDDQMRALQDAFWDSQMRNNPTLATWYGVYEYNDKMESFSISRFEEDRNRTQGYFDQLLTIDRDHLNADNRINYDILKDILQTFLNGSIWQDYGSLSPITRMGSMRGPNMAASSTRGDYENYITRLYAVQQQVDEIILRGRLAIELNRTLHNVSLTTVPANIDRSLFDTPEESSYYHLYFGQRLNDSNVRNETDKEILRQRGRDAVTAYMNALRQLKNFIVNEYMPHTRTEYGVWAWDDSGNYYTECIKWHLSIPMTPDEVHNVGLEEVDKISKAMQQIMAKLNFQGTVSEFFNSLKGDPRFYTNDTDKILSFVNHVVNDRIKPKLSTVLKDPIPDIPMVIEPAPTDRSVASYSRASETSPGRYYINLFRPLEVPFFEMMALSLHEADPGHHMQHSYSMRAGLPDFRREPVYSFHDVPNSFPVYTSYSEGWGLYSEYLGIEMGMYKDDYEMMGRYSYDILRAARLVVDTGLHYYKWSRQQAVDYLLNYTAYGVGTAENAIDRYITLPGQACAYKIGEIRLRQLRTKAETELGDNFEVKDFHSLILENGAMPMALLERMTDAWIEEKKRVTRSSAVSRHRYVMQTLTVLSLILLRHFA